MWCQLITLWSCRYKITSDSLEQRDLFSLIQIGVASGKAMWMQFSCQYVLLHLLLGRNLILFCNSVKQQQTVEQENIVYFVYIIQLKQKQACSGYQFLILAVSFIEGRGCTSSYFTQKKWQIESDLKTPLFCCLSENPF